MQRREVSIIKAKARYQFCNLLRRTYCLWYQKIMLSYYTLMSWDISSQFWFLVSDNLPITRTVLKHGSCSLFDSVETKMLLCFNFSFGFLSHNMFTSGSPTRFLPKYLNYSMISALIFSYFLFFNILKAIPSNYGASYRSGFVPLNILLMVPNSQI